MWKRDVSEPFVCLYSREDCDLVLDDAYCPFSVYRVGELIGETEASERDRRSRIARQLDCQKRYYKQSSLGLFKQIDQTGRKMVTIETFRF